VARTWNAAVIGCGSIAQHMHIPGYAGCPGVRLVAACDPEPARRKEVERLCPGLRTYDDYRKLLSAERVDVVSVASPNCFHALNTRARRCGQGPMCSWRSLRR